MSSIAASSETAPAFRASDVARVARARTGLILAIAALVVAAAFAVLQVWPTLYTASASVMLDPRKNNITDLSAVLSQLPTDPASLQNQIQILQSRDLAERVIVKLKLYDDPEFTKSVKQDEDPVQAH